MATDLRDRPGSHDRGTDADAPQEIPPRGWKEVAMRVKEQAKEDNVVLLSGGVAFFGLLALIPALIAIVSVYGLVANPDDVQRQVADLTAAAPAEVRDVLVSQLESITSSSSAGLGIGAVVGLAVALWSASSGLKHLMEAVNVAYDERETRGFVKVRGLALGLTVAAVVFLVVTFFLVAVLPAWLSEVGLGSAGRWAMSILRWPLLAIAMVVALAVLYRLAPDRDDPRWRWVSVGSVVGTVLWIVASIAFSIYSANFGSYNETYGSLSAIVVLLLWLAITAFCVILGAELNAELEQQTGRDSTRGPDQPIGTRGAEAADSTPPAEHEAGAGR